MMDSLDKSHFTHDPRAMEERLVTVFNDAIVLTNNFRIRAVSHSLLTVLGYSHEDLVDRKIGVLLQDPDVVLRVGGELSTGAFRDLETRITCSHGKAMLVRLSGFHLHLITNIEGYVILKIQNLDDLEIAHGKLQQKTHELENLVYRAWHDLRGPIATILGVMSLARMRKDDSEVNLFLDLISVHVQKLDRHLKDMLNTIQG
jgi:PAS domain S-box-containing protein